VGLVLSSNQAKPKAHSLKAMPLWLNLLAAGRYACGCGCACLLAATTGLCGTFGSFADQLHNHDAGYELLGANAVEIDRGTFAIGFGHDPKTVLIVLDALPFGKNLHNNLLVYFGNSERWVSWAGSNTF
jgi:hypothetical protein